MSQFLERHSRRDMSVTDEVKREGAEKIYSPSLSTRGVREIPEYAPSIANFKRNVNSFLRLKTYLNKLLFKSKVDRIMRWKFAEKR